MALFPARLSAAALIVVAALGAAPAPAYLYWTRPSFSGQPAKGDEPGIALPMPGATPKELQANMLWAMRAGLNVAALQCQFEPTLLTVQNYNALLADHRDELAASFATLDKYFARTGGTKAKGQAALDQFGTRTYASFATVAAQYNFCRPARAIGYGAITRPRGAFADLSLDRIRELRNSMVPFGEQQFGRVDPYPSLPRFDKACWSGKNYKMVCGFGR